MNDFESLIEFASILEQQNDFQEVLRLTTQKAASLMEAETALVMMINPSTRETVRTIYREERGTDNKQYQFVHTYFSGWVFDNRQAFLAENIQTDSRFNRNILKDFPIKSVMCAPLMAEGMITGSLLLLNKVNGGEFSKSDFEYFKKFATIISPFLRNIHKIQQYFTAPIPETAVLKKYEACGLLGKSKPFIELLNAIEAAAKCDVRVLLEGGSGTGKELIAKAIHQFSSRIQNKFITIDCGAMPANLMESELFGHIKGAFTGATTSRKGLLEEANGGTLFMDEIANLPMELQSKLLRVLQEREIRSLGSNEVRKVDVRIIAASSSSLRQLVVAKQFREDLFYRLYVFPIIVPSLADRKGDITLLANYFLKIYSQRQQKKTEVFHEELLEFLKHREWSGNIRELENFVERLVTLAPQDAKILDHKLLPEEFRNEREKMKMSGRQITFREPLKKMLSEYEKHVIQKVLADCDWNQSKAARILKISEHSMRYKIDKLKIDKPLDNQPE
jgi:transcriptional regulator with GAF, ATPase, and Fis domain